MKRLKLVAVVSTGGAVLNEVLGSGFFRERVHSVVSDRPCEGEAKAAAHGVPVHAFHDPDPETFSARLRTHLDENGIDYVVSYYTNFFSQALRDAYRDRLINLHPSVLPAFKGMDGFGDTVKYHARFAGNTVEFIDQVMDEGKMILQTVCPLDPEDVAGTRHTVFVHQCRALLQVVRWLEEDRIRVDGRRVTVAGARYDQPMFSPSLDSEEAIRWTPPSPGE